MATDEAWEREAIDLVLAEGAVQATQVHALLDA
jgi:hypothetical protein